MYKGPGNGKFWNELQICTRIYLQQHVTQKFGTDTANKVIREMTKSLRDLQQFENKGVSVEKVLGIPSCDYRMLYVPHNYVFYQINADAIKITDIYNEKEDFMWKLFYNNNTCCRPPRFITLHLCFYEVRIH